MRNYLCGYPYRSAYSVKYKLAFWWSIKNDYRTLVGLEDVDLVDTAIAEDEADE